MSRELTKCHFQSIESTISINSAWTYLIQVLNAKKPGTKNSPAILLGLILIQVLDSTKSRHSTELTKCQIQSIILIQVLDSEKSCQSNGNSKNATFSKLHTQERIDFNKQVRRCIYCQQNSRNATFCPLNLPIQSILLGPILIQVLNSKKTGNKILQQF